MATSGNYTYNQFAIELINDAWYTAGVQNPSQEQIARGYRALNKIMKALQNEHINIWTLEWKTKTFSAASEVTGSDSNIYTCIRSHTSAASNKPVTGANWTTYWVLRGTTGGVWAAETSYTSLGDFALDADTLDIITGYMRDVDDDSPPMRILSSAEYAAVPDKMDEDEPYGFWIDRSETPYRLYFDKQIDDTTNVFHYHQVRIIEDVTYLNNNLDFKSRWLLALEYMLADILIDGQNTDISVKSRISRKAESFLKNAKHGDTERGGEHFIRSAY